jgi:hypothetical protein
VTKYAEIANELVHITDQLMARMDAMEEGVEKSPWHTRCLLAEANHTLQALDVLELSVQEMQAKTSDDLSKVASILATSKTELQHLLEKYGPKT